MSPKSHKNPSAGRAGTVHVTVKGYPSPGTRSHACASHWRLTPKRKHLVVVDPTGAEIARYPAHRWIEVWWTPDVPPAAEDAFAGYVLPEDATSLGDLSDG